MRDTNTGSDDRGNLERIGESAGAMAGRAADFGLEMTGALFRSAAELLGGWWSTDEPVRAAGSWNHAEPEFRSHYQAAASTAGTTTSASTGASGGVGATQATRTAPKSTSAAMQVDSGEIGGTAKIGDTRVSGAARFDSASDGFERAKPGYQLGYVARQNPAYRNRSFNEVEPDLKRVWESRAKTVSSSGPGAQGSTDAWPEVRGFVDFAYQQDEARR